jgi:hypothetical protein
MSFSVGELGEDTPAPRLREQLPRPVERQPAGESGVGIRNVQTRPGVSSDDRRKFALLLITGLGVD